MRAFEAAMGSQPHGGPESAARREQKWDTLMDHQRTLGFCSLYWIRYP